MGVRLTTQTERPHERNLNSRFPPIPLTHPKSTFAGLGTTHWISHSPGRNPAGLSSHVRVTSVTSVTSGSVRSGTDLLYSCLSVAFIP